MPQSEEKSSAPMTDIERQRVIIANAIAGLELGPTMAAFELADGNTRRTSRLYEYPEKHFFSRHGVYDPLPESIEAKK